MYTTYKSPKILLLALCLVGFAGFLQAQTVFVTVGISQPASLTANAGADQSVCEGSDILLGGSPSATGGTMAYTYSWAPSGDLNSDTLGNPMATPTATTTYTLSVSDVNNCTDTDDIVITVNALPAPAFSEVVAPNGLDVDFTDATPGNIVSWIWDFGDGNTSTMQNPSHSYTANGTYTVCLGTTDNNGCFAEICQPVNAIVGIEDAQLAGFTVSPNPYNGATNVSFVLSGNESVALEAFDVLGKRISVLAKLDLPAGEHRYQFSAADLGHPAGVYMLRLSIGEQSQTLRVVEVE